MSNPNVVVIGGGSGTSNLLGEIKHFTNNISAVVNMSDDGGSSGVIREKYGLMPPGDVRRCIAALSPDLELAERFEYRYPKDHIFANHTRGNLELARLERRLGCFGAAVRKASQDLHITGQVLPVTLDKHELLLWDAGRHIRGEQKIATHQIKSRDALIKHAPAAYVSPPAAKAIAAAEAIIIAPGHLYGSILPTLATAGLSEAIATSKARKIMVSNLVNTRGQTDGWHVIDYVQEVERYIGSAQLDYVLYNLQNPTQKSVIRQGETMVGTDNRLFCKIRALSLGANLLGEDAPISDIAGGISRNRLRHNAEVVARLVFKLIMSGGLGNE